jgi:hypothetical protein
MKTPLHIIHEKIGAIEVGLLRYRYKDTKISLPAHISMDSNELLHCVITADTPGHRLVNREINLVQKDKDNYMYVDGRISRIIKKEKEFVVFIDIRKAFWFVRKRKGSVTFLHEKSFYENMAAIKLAS